MMKFFTTTLIAFSVMVCATAQENNAAKKITTDSISLLNELVVTASMLNWEEARTSSWERRVEAWVAAWADSTDWKRMKAVPRLAPVCGFTTSLA